MTSNQQKSGVNMNKIDNRIKQAKTLARRDAKAEAKKEVKRLEKRMAESGLFGQMPAARSGRRQLAISKYLYSLMDPECMNIPHPAIGPYPTRQMVLTSRFIVRTNSSGVCAWTCQPTQLYPEPVSATGNGFWHQWFGTTIDAVGGVTVIGEGETNNTCGPTWLDALTDVASTGYLNSASMSVDYIGGTFNDSGVIAFASLPQQDTTTSEPSPPYSEKLASYPLGGENPAPAGCHLVWLPEVWDNPCRALIKSYVTRNTNTGFPDSTMVWRCYAQTGVTSGDAFLVTVTQNFSFITMTKIFAPTASRGNSHMSGIQRSVEQSALAKMAVSGANQTTPLAVPTSDGSGKADMKRKLIKNRTKSLTKFLKEGYEAVSPFAKLLWNNRTTIGNYLSDIVSPSTIMKELPASTVVIEEIAEEAPLLALAL
jgi:hypothetical protein